MAGIPARAPACEAALTGKPWSEATVEAAAAGAGRGLSAAQRPARIGRISPRRRRQSGARPLARAREPARCLTVARPLRHDSAEGHVAGSALYVDDLPEAPGTLHLAFGLAADGHARLTGARSRRGPRRAGRGRGLHRRRHPRREQCRPGLPRRPALRRGRDPLSRPALVRRRRDQQSRRARRRAAGEGRDRAAARARHHRRGARRRARSSKPPQRMARGDAAGRARRRAAPPVRAASRWAGRSISTSKARPRSPRRARRASSMSSARPSIRARSSI